MIAMQYSFIFPADYDMSIIRKRIAEHGSKLDDYPDMYWKNYLWTEKNEDNGQSNNTYAPFYLWNSSDGMNRFLGSVGFNKLCHDFGRPNVEIWSVLDYFSTPQLKAASWMARQIQSIPAGQSLADLQTELNQFAKQAMHAGAITVVTAFDPHKWQTLRVSTWQKPTETLMGKTQCDCYNIGYIAAGGAWQNK